MSETEMLGPYRVEYRSKSEEPGMFHAAVTLRKGGRTIEIHYPPTFRTAAEAIEYAREETALRYRNGDL